MKTSSKIIVGVVALAVAVFALLGFLSSHSGTPATDNGPSAGFSQSNPGQFEEGAQIGSVGDRYYSGTLSASQFQDQGSYHNTSGRDQFVKMLILHTTGTASSTQTLTAGTSTSATFNGFSVPSTVKSFLNVTVATSTVATTTNSIQGIGAPSGDGAGVVRLADGDYFNFGLYQTYGTKCTGSVCETATSTNRGFDVRYVLEVLQPVSY